MDTYSSLRMMRSESGTWQSNSLARGLQKNEYFWVGLQALISRDRLHRFLMQNYFFQLLFELLPLSHQATRRINFSQAHNYNTRPSRYLPTSFMPAFIFKLICLLLTIVRSLAQSGLDSQFHIPSYPVVDEPSWSLDLGHDSTGTVSQLDNVAFDPTSPSESDLAAPVAGENTAQCQHSRKLRRRGEACEPPAGSQFTGKDAPTSEKKNYGSDRPWWQRIWRADDPEPDTSRTYDTPRLRTGTTCPVLPVRSHR